MLFFYLRYDFLPLVKVRLRFWWWIVRYGGKKRIPKEVILQAMARSFERMNSNLQKAQDFSRLEDLSEEERKAIRDARIQSKELEAKIQAAMENKETD